MLSSYAATFTVFGYLPPIEVIYLQALNKQLYSTLGVARVQIKVPTRAWLFFASLLCSNAVFKYCDSPESFVKVRSTKFYFSGAAVQVGNNLYSINFDNLAVRRFPNIANCTATSARCEILQQDFFLGEDCFDGSATNFCDQAIFLTGGRTSKGEPIRAVNKYRISTNEWIPNQPTLNEGRAYHGSCTMNRKVYVFGGYCKFRKLDSIESYDDGGKAWRLIYVPKSLICGSCTACPLDDTQVLIFGDYGSKN